MNRMKKLQRPKRLTTDNDGDQKGAKPEKRARLSLDAWWQKPPLPEEETIDTLKNYLEKKLHSLKKKKDVKSHRDFLEHTYALRRIQILENPCPVREVLESYPSLRQFVHVSTQLNQLKQTNRGDSPVNKYGLKMTQTTPIMEAILCKNVTTYMYFPYVKRVGS